jgi:hypothetical protein
MPLRRAVLALPVAALALASARCDGTTCVDRNPDVGAVCVPAAVQPDQSAVIEVRESCGLCSSTPHCDTRLIVGEVHVDLHAQICNDGSVRCDTNLCLQRIVRCTLPSLPAGDWPLVLPGNQVRLLRVREGGLRACQLPAP